MTADLSIFDLVLGASFVVQAVMFALLLASLASWTFIFERWKTLKQAYISAHRFEDEFWSGGDLGTLYKKVSAQKHKPSGMADIFQAGFREFAKLRGQTGIDPATVVSGSQRAMRVALTREMDTLEMHLPFLATVASTSPYVGLFGTVWGIMNAFRNLAGPLASQQPTLATVAPGISEALIATAMGLFAAIPAVIAYNRYINDVERLNSRYDAFMDEFTSILQRQVHL